MEQKKRALIVTGGTVSQSQLSNVLEQETYDLVIAVDNGLLALHQAGRQPDIIVGDFDTVDPALIQWYQNKPGVAVRQFCPEKDATDTEIAIELVIEAGVQEVILIGALGTRIDHSIANIMLLLPLLKKQIQGKILDEHNLIYMTQQPVYLRREECFGTYVSLLPITEQVTGITLVGMKYPLNHAVLNQGSSLGISNEIVCAQAQILLEEGILLIIEAKD